VWFTTKDTKSTKNDGVDDGHISRDGRPAIADLTTFPNPSAPKKQNLRGLRALRGEKKMSSTRHSALFACVLYAVTVVACGGTVAHEEGDVGYGGQSDAGVDSGLDAQAGSVDGSAAGTGGAAGSNDSSAGSAGVSEAGKDEGLPDDGGPDCSGVAPGALVGIVGGYGIDGHEVTWCEYASWLATGPSTATQDPWCAWNDAFTADAACMTGMTICKDSSCGNNPVVCVDWCDAHAYCAGIGKRLCGRVGGGQNAPADSVDASRSQWFNACSSGNAHHNYPYGGDSQVGSTDGYGGQKCNGQDFGWGMTLESGSVHMASCASSESGYGSVYNLSGNVAEWEDSCDGATGPQDSCLLRGGSFRSDAMGLSCQAQELGLRMLVRDDVGFRCCSSP